MAEDQSTSRFLTAEFNAMDKDKDGQLSSSEICDILIYQGINLHERYLNKNLFEKFGVLLTNNEFQEFMQSIPKEPRNLRTIFQSFHQERDDYASKQSIREGLIKMDVTNSQPLVDQMKTDDGGLVSYENFLQVYFNSKQ